MKFNTNLQQFNGFLNSHPIFKDKTTLLAYRNFEIIKKKPNKSIFLDIKENLMLGKRVELFFKKYVDLLSDYTMLIENLQIIDDKITIGEIDFILEKNGQKYHIELSYKFYLYDPSIGGDEIANWIGPNRNDSLAKKLEKLNKKQFPLLKNPTTELKLKTLNINSKKCKQKVCYLGQLFIPKENSKHRFQEINTQAIQGYYQNFSAFSSKADKDAMYFVPDKKNWLCIPTKKEEWISLEKAKQIIEVQIVQKKSPMVWIKDKEEKLTKEFITWW